MHREGLQFKGEIIIILNNALMHCEGLQFKGQIFIILTIKACKALRSGLRPSDGLLNYYL